MAAVARSILTPTQVYIYEELALAVYRMREPEILWWNAVVKPRLPGCIIGTLLLTATVSLAMAIIAGLNTLYCRGTIETLWRTTCPPTGLRWERDGLACLGVFMGTLVFGVMIACIHYENRRSPEVA